MILRRFIQHVTDQNWFAVGIDLLVVVTGIFLGMQVTQWNDARELQKIEKSHLEILRQSMDENIGVFEQALDLQLSLYANHIDVLSRLKQNEWSDEDEEFVRQNILNITFWRSIDFRLGGIESLINSGELSIVQNRSIQSSLVETLANVETLKSQLDYNRAWYTRWNTNFPEYVGVDISIPDHKPSLADVRTIEGVKEIAELISISESNERLKSEEVQRTYAMVIALRANWVSQISIYLEDAKMTRDLIKSELEEFS